MLPWNAEDLTFDETRFKGTARLFPLSDLVMFPHVVQPLHIFEQRYRDMLNDALDSDGLIAMSVLDPNRGLDDHGRPALSPFACLGKVVTHHRLDDGCYNLMLLGVRRVQILKELTQHHSYREAEIELLEDDRLPLADSSRDQLQLQLTQAFQKAMPEGSLPTESASELLAEELPLGVLTDLVSFALPLPLDFKRKMLSERNIDVRARQLLQRLAPEQPSQTFDSLDAALFIPGKFPPRFSAN